MPNPLSERRAPSIQSTAGVQLLPFMQRRLLRGGAAVMAIAYEVLGFSAPTQACRASRSGECAALWLGPDERLLLTGSDEGAAMSARLEQALAPYPYALVDVSHRQVSLQVCGAHCEILLAAGCALDLDAAYFPVDMCTRTLLAKAEIVLWRTAPQCFQIEVWRSFAAYVAGFLNVAAREFDAGG